MKKKILITGIIILFIAGFFLFTSPMEDTEFKQSLTDYSENDWSSKPQNAFIGQTVTEGYNAKASIVVDDAPFLFQQMKINQAHNNGIKYGLFLSIISREDSGDTLPETHAKDLNGESFSEHDGIDWPVHSTINSEWQEFLINTVKDAIDKGADVIVLDDDDGLAFFTFTGADNNLGDFSEENMQGLNNYLKNKYTSEELKNKGINDINTFNYREYLISEGYTQEDILRDVENSFYRGSEYSTPLWNDFCYYTLNQTNEFIITLITEGKKHAENQGKQVMFVPYPQDITKYYVLETELPYDLLSGEIMFFDSTGFPPRGRASGWHKLGFSLINKPRCAKPPDYLPEITPSIEWGGDNLWKLRYAESYTHRGCILNKYAFTTVPVTNLYFINKSMVGELFNFVMNYDELFNTKNLETIPEALVLKSINSVKNNFGEEQAAFVSTTSILDKSHIQYDVELTNKELNLSNYELILLPHIVSESEEFYQKVLDYVSRGGNVLYYNLDTDVYPHPGMIKDFNNGVNNYGEGIFYFFDKGYFAYPYFQWQVYNKDIVNLMNLDEYENVPNSNFETELTEFKGAINTLIPEQFVNTNTKDVTLQAYKLSNKIIIHALNFDYTITTDTVNKKEDVIISFRNETIIDNITLISPDLKNEERINYTISNGFINLTIPELNAWSIIQIS